MIAALAGQGYDVKRCCRILAVAPSGYFSWRRRTPSPAELRRGWLRGLIDEIHAGSRGVYGYRRIRAELRLGRQIMVSRKLVHKLMAEARLKGLPVRKQRKNLANVATADDLVCTDLAFYDLEPALVPPSTSASGSVATRSLYDLLSQVPAGAGSGPPSEYALFKPVKIPSGKTTKTVFVDGATPAESLHHAADGGITTENSRPPPPGHHRTFDEFAIDDADR